MRVANKLLLLVFPVLVLLFLSFFEAHGNTHEELDKAILAKELNQCLFKYADYNNDGAIASQEIGRFNAELAKGENLKYLVSENIFIDSNGEALSSGELSRRLRHYCLLKEQEQD